MAATNTVAENIVCEDCGTHVPTRVQGEPGETACPDCGLVLETYRIDHGPDWYSGTDNAKLDNRSRAKVPNRNHVDRGLGTQLGHPQERQGRTQRLAALDAKGHTRKDRNRGYATGEIQRIGTRIGFTNPVIMDAKHYFKRLHEQGRVSGYDLDTLTASCLYASSRVHGTGRVPSELAEVSRCSEKEISRRVWHVASELDLEIPPPDVEARLRVVAAKLDLRQNVVRDAIEDLRGMDQSVVSMGKPSGVVAAVLYRNTRLTQSRVGDAAGVSEVTVRSARDRLYPN